jgi:drug/metabolite transporter (DMT)-like permease
MPEPRRQIPEPTYHWPGGLTADDDPTPLESALAALKIGAILAAGVTIVFFYLATYTGFVVARAEASFAVIVAFALPSVMAFLRTAWVRRRRRPPGT